MEGLSFFDCNCIVGRRTRKFPGSFHSRADLAAAMARYGIGKALIYHSMAREHSPSVGNDLVIQETAGETAFLPAWVVVPHHTGELPPPRDLLDQMRTRGVRAVRMFPAEMSQNYSVAEWNCGSLFSALEEHHVPLFLPLDQVDWAAVHEILTRHPALDLLLTDVDYRIDRSAFALLEQFPRLRLEVAGYKVHRGIEEVCRRFGAEHLVFGSGMPVYSGAAAASLVRYARISDAEKALIAHGNLDAMLGGALHG